jgi:hypothetical protein
MEAELFWGRSTDASHPWLTFPDSNIQGELFWGRSTDTRHPWLTFRISKIEGLRQCFVPRGARSVVAVDGMGWPMFVLAGGAMELFSLE